MKDIPPLRDYQIADLAYYIANPRCMNLSDPGTGKTPSVCVMQFHLWVNEQARTAWAISRTGLRWRAGHRRARMPRVSSSTPRASGRVR